jgi:hypothetical protein
MKVRPLKTGNAHNRKNQVLSEEKGQISSKLRTKDGLRARWPQALEGYKYSDVKCDGEERRKNPVHGLRNMGGGALVAFMTSGFSRNIGGGALVGAMTSGFSRNIGGGALVGAIRRGFSCTFTDASKTDTDASTVWVRVGFLSDPANAVAHKMAPKAKSNTKTFKSRSIRPKTSRTRSLGARGSALKRFEEKDTELNAESRPWIDLWALFRYQPCMQGHRLFQVFALGFTILFAASFVNCGSTACNATNCATGCCDASGLCQNASVDSCGISGARCQTCQAQQICSVGACANLNIPGTGGGLADGGATTADGGMVTVPNTGACAGGLIFCDGQCKDSQADETNCGQCGSICTAGRVCNRGRCEVLPDDCTVASQCAPGFACDPLTKKCLPGCQTPLDCPSMSTCSSNMCSCGPGTHACGQACVDSASIQSCGGSCVSCPAVANGATTCDGIACGFKCNEGYGSTGSACVFGPHWQRREIVGQGPFARSNSAMVYDSRRQTLVLYGGQPFPSGYASNDLWELKDSQWKFVSNASGPGSRHSHAMVYDPGLARVVVFGGRSDFGLGGTPLFDAWQYTVSGWTELKLKGDLSIARRYRMVYNSTRLKVWFYSNDNNPLEVWELTGDTLVRLSASNSPSNRSGSAVAFDSARSKLVVFGGYGTTYLNETWQFDGQAWSQLDAAKPAPSPRTTGSMVYDVARSRIMLVGGDGPTVGRLRDTWEFDGINWTQVNAVGLLPKRSNTQWIFAYDSMRSKVVLFGGSGDYVQEDVWEFVP